MKFNKEKTKKFASGGKTPKEIMEEARRNQAIERQAQARDVVRTSGIPAFQSQHVSINVPRPTVDLTTPDLTQRTDLKSMFKTRGEAFNYARKQGWTDFNWGGGIFHTKTAEEVSGAATSQTTSQPLTPSNDVQDLVTEPPTETSTETSVIVDPQWGTYGQFPRTAPRSTATATSTSATQSSSNWWERFNENNAKRRERARNRSSRGVPEVLQRIGHVTNKLSMKYKQGGQLPSYQQGGIVSDFKNWISSLMKAPNKYQVNSDTYTTYTKKDPFIGRSSETRSIVGPNGQTSTMIIKGIAEENPAKIDTTFISPGYIKNPDLYPKFTPQDIREGNRKGKGKESYLEKFTSPTYFPHIGKHQQGGKVEAPTDEMYVDFAVRFLSKLGVGEQDMVDEEGGLKDEHAETVTVALQELESTPEFWDTYVSDPDAAVDAYIESKQSPEQIEMARKGAKLKKLQKLKKGTAKKCKCGCDLIIKKEKGGTITEVCSCGCKAK